MNDWISSNIDSLFQGFLGLGIMVHGVLDSRKTEFGQKKLPKWYPYLGAILFGTAVLSIAMNISLSSFLIR